VVHKHYR